VSSNRLSFWRLRVRLLPLITQKRKHKMAEKVNQRERKNVEEDTLL
jgi:hypothetical protein